MASARSKSQQKKRRRESVEDGDDDDDDDEEPLGDLLNTTSGLLSRTRPSVIPPETLAIQPLRDANVSERSKSAIKVIRFHPAPTVPVLVAADAERRLRLFNVRLLPCSISPYTQLLYRLTVILTLHFKLFTSPTSLYPTPLFTRQAPRFYSRAQDHSSIRTICRPPLASGPRAVSGGRTLRKHRTSPITTSRPAHFHQTAPFWRLRAAADISISSIGAHRPAASPVRSWAHSR